MKTIRSRAPWLLTLFLGIGLMLAAAPFLSGRAAAYPVQSAAQTMYRGSLKWYIADLKTSFPEHTKFYSPQTALTEANYRIVLDGLKNNVKVNGVRLPIFPTEPDPASYAPLYKNIFAYARSIGLVIYASPLSVGKADYSGWSDAQYARWLADYANYYAPDFLSPYNESSASDQEIVSVVGQLRAMLKVRTLLVGPDRQHLDGSLRALTKDNGTILSTFDIISSHNAGKDDSPTAANWSALVQMAARYGKPAWSSENPREWEASEGMPGLSDAVAGGVQGLVIWWAKPKLINDYGQPTAKAIDIASHIVQQ